MSNLEVIVANQIDFSPADFGIEPNTGKEMTHAFRALFQKASETDGEKYVKLVPGTYEFYSENAEQKLYYISNTMAEKEVKQPLHFVPLVLSTVSDFVIDGEGAEFLMHGTMTNFVIENCKNIVLKGISFDHKRPSVTEVTVLEKKGLTAKFKINADCTWELENNRPIFFGDNFRFATTDNILGQWANVILPANDPEHIWRTHKHPFISARKYKDLGDNVLEVKYAWFPPFRVGDRFALHETTRREVGIFIQNSSDILLHGIKEYYNHSHAYVAQVSNNITIQECWNAPREGSGRFTSSQADYCHFSVCGGKISVLDTKFDGAFDDVCNVHGFHFKLIKAEVDSISVKFMHPQGYGFLPFEIGDKIEFINADTLVPSGITAIVQAATMEDNYVVNLVLDTAVAKNVSAGMMVENVSKCADVVFSGNKMTHITTRGILITTRGKVLIENNDFYKTGMSGVLISDDAKSWFESGCVRDVTIRGNRFTECGGQAVFVWPEYKRFEKQVHKNILIENNDITVKGTRAICLKGAENVEITGNRVFGKAGSNGYFTEKECKGVKIHHNDIKK